MRNRLAVALLALLIVPSLAAGASRPLGDTGWQVDDPDGLPFLGSGDNGARWGRDWDTPVRRAGKGSRARSQHQRESLEALIERDDAPAPCAPEKERLRAPFGRPAREFVCPALESGAPEHHFVLKLEGGRAIHVTYKHTWNAPFDPKGAALLAKPRPLAPHLASFRAVVESLRPKTATARVVSAAPAARPQAAAPPVAAAAAPPPSAAAAAAPAPPAAEPAKPPLYEGEAPLLRSAVAAPAVQPAAPSENAPGAPLSALAPAAPVPAPAPASAPSNGALGLIAGGLALGIGLGLTLVLARRGRGDGAASPASWPTVGRTAPSRVLTPPPTAAGRYTVGRQLGTGGMGVVYEGFDATLGRRVALKQMRAELKDSETDRALFLEEARIVARLSHPYIVTFHEVVEDAGEIFLVFDYVDGQPLSTRLRQGRLQVPQAQRVFTQVCEALSCAHRAHVLHRDLKPANIMVGNDGYAKVMDFGIARQAKDTITRLTSIDAAGTPAYMAPEQHMGRCNKASDIYALGVCLYESLTGQLPFQGPDFLSQKERMKYPPPQFLNPDLPKVSELLFQVTLAADPAKRVADAEELIESLKRLG